MRKDGKVNERLFVANSVTLATRVTLEILRAIMRKYLNATEDMFVMGFNSGPALVVRWKDRVGQFAHIFVDVIVRYGGKVKEADLGLAYEWAGESFDGAMQQNSVVLTDKERVGGRQSQGLVLLVFPS